LTDIENEIMRMNPSLQDANVLQAGMTLKLPGKAKAEARPQVPDGLVEAANAAALEGISGIGGGSATSETGEVSGPTVDPATGLPTDNDPAVKALNTELNGLFEKYPEPGTRPAEARTRMLEIAGELGAIYMAAATTPEIAQQVQTTYMQLVSSIETASPKVDGLTAAAAEKWKEFDFPPEGEKLSEDEQKDLAKKLYEFADDNTATLFAPTFAKAASEGKTFNELDKASAFAMIGESMHLEPNGSSPESPYEAGSDEYKKIESVYNEMVDQGGSPPNVAKIPIMLNTEQTGPVETTLFELKCDDGEIRYVDAEGRSYESFDDWKENNKLPPGRMTIPKNDNDLDGEFTTVNTPETKDTWQEKALGVLDKALPIAGIIAGGVLCFTGVGAPLGLAMMGVSIASAGYGVTRGIQQLDDYHDHGGIEWSDPNARMAIFNTAGNALAFTGFAKAAQMGLAARSASQAGKTMASMAAAPSTVKGLVGTAAVTTMANGGKMATGSRLMMMGNGAAAFGIGEAQLDLLWNNWGSMSGTERLTAMGTIAATTVVSGLGWRAFRTGNWSNVLNRTKVTAPTTSATTAAGSGATTMSSSKALAVPTSPAAFQGPSAWENFMKMKLSTATSAKDLTSLRRTLFKQYVGSHGENSAAVSALNRMHDQVSMANGWWTKGHSATFRG
jgi:hypothetical protein